MWKRDQVGLPGNNEPPASPPPSPTPSTPVQPPVVAAPSARPSQSPVPIGKSVVMKGELSGSEDLAVEGTVEGTIELRDNVLTIGPNGRIKAQIFARTVIVLGRSTATSRRQTASTSAMPARSTGTSWRRGWGSRTAPISGEALTCRRRVPTWSSRPRRVRTARQASHTSRAAEQSRLWAELPSDQRIADCPEPRTQAVSNVRSSDCGRPASVSRTASTIASSNCVPPATCS